MSDRVWEKISFYFSVFAVSVLFGYALFVSGVEVRDLDLWLHLATGKYITQTGIIPQTDILSCSIAGKPWVNHEWLFQVILYNLYRMGGTQGLIIGQVILTTATLGMLLLIGYSRLGILWTGFLLTVVELVYQQRFTHRPDLFSLFFFAAYILILSRHLRRRWSLWAIIFLQIIWTNTHGFFFFGPLLLLLWFTAEFLRRRVKLPCEWNRSGALADAEYNRVGLMFLLSLGACLINPLFINGALYPVRVFFSLSGENRIFFTYIQELQKPIAAANWMDLTRYEYYKLMIVLSVVFFILNRRRWDLNVCFIWIVFFIFSLTALRNISFFAFAAYFAILTNSRTIPWRDIIPIEFRDKKFFYVIMIFLSLSLAAWILNYSQDVASRGYFDWDVFSRKSEYGGISKRTYPYGGARFLIQQRIKGNFFNDFNSGAYLLGTCYPDIKVYIDGRTEVYGGDFFRDYIRVWSDGNKKVFFDQVRRFHLTGAFLGSPRLLIPKSVLRMLYQSKDWKLVYFDADAVIFLRDIPQNQAVIKAHLVDLSRWKTNTEDLWRVGTNRVTATPYYHRAYMLDALGYSGAALTELKEALRIDPDYADADHLMGSIYAKRNEFFAAYVCFRNAVQFDPENQEAWRYMAQAAYDANKMEVAVSEYQDIYKKWPGPQPAFALAQSFVRLKKYDQGWNWLKTAHQLDPKAFVDILKIGDAVFADGQFALAKKIYRLGLETGKNNAVIAARLKKVQASLAGKK
ncbi:MAG: hypothetical protein HQL23_01280 [Candidatus Omnitrophica bacterium]|nr:hypothetical protein [Candidatus Omnitrophota bacterium]